jgi:hypothetical protein
MTEQHVKRDVLLAQPTKEFITVGEVAGGWTAV